MVFSGGVLLLASKGVNPLPALGIAFNPGTGVWTVAKEATVPKSQTLHLSFLYKYVTVAFDGNDVA